MFISISFFFLFIRPPPISTLFPYTTLFRSAIASVNILELLNYTEDPQNVASTYQSEDYFRSEEHTSELQSRGHLVCRLLLEKKNERMLQSQIVPDPHHKYYRPSSVHK